MIDLLEILEKLDDIINDFLCGHGLHKWSDGIRFVNGDGEWVEVCMRGGCTTEKIIPSDHPLMIRGCLRKLDIRTGLKLLWRTRSLSYINRQFNLI